MASIELKSIFGKGIKSLVPFQKPSLSTVISLTNLNQPSLKKNKKKTTVGRSNGQNPVWGQPILIDIDSGPYRNLIVRFDLKADALLGDRVVGRAFIPVTDLDFSGAVQHVRYQVKTPAGKANGAITLSYKVDGPGTAVSPPILPGPTLAMDYSPPAQTFYPALSAPPLSAYSPTVDPVVAYPPPGKAASGIYPPPDLTIAYPPSMSSAGYHPTIEPGVSYPPLQAFLPKPATECCCRPIPQLPLAWYVPSGQQPAPAFYYPSPVPDAYGYQQRGWDQGLYGYN